MAKEPLQTVQTVVPECSVCLQPYDDSAVLPRVLSCGHSLCETCISSLANANVQDDDEGRPSTFLRCPECNHRSKLHDLPKNIELLRFIEGSGGPGPEALRKHQVSVSVRSAYYSGSGPGFVYDASVAELCRWIVPQRSARMEDHGRSGEVVLCRGEDSLESAHSASFVCLQGACQEGKRVVGLEYRKHIRMRLQRLAGNEVKDLLRLIRIERGVFGIWMDIADGCLYLVYKKFPNIQLLAGSLLNKSTTSLDFCGRKRCLELCEIFMNLHAERVIVGLLNLPCLGNSDLMHLHLDLGIFLSTRKALFNVMKSEKFAGLESIITWEVPDLIDPCTFCYCSPDLLQLIQNPDTNANCEVSCKTDSWTFACLFCKIFVGETPWDNLTLVKFIENSAHCKENALSWFENHFELDKLDSEALIAKVVRIIIRCFSYSPNERPCISEVWNLLYGSQDLSPTVNGTTPCCNAGAGGSCATLWCLILGCDIHENSSNGILDKQNTSDSLANPSCPEPSERNLSIAKDYEPRLQKSCNLEGHVDDVTCLAIFGKYLLSASLDKTICVWSLKDDSLMKCYRGHTQKVMALACNQQSSIFVSGDYGGELFVWDVESREESCLNKWHHHRDWRYSGVASLAISKDSLLYSGAGDKTIKVWSLQDYSLVRNLEGHKALVSALLVDGEILISGSWDGTVRLWWRSDHCPLAILNDSMELGGVLSLARSTELLLIGYQNGMIQVWRDEVCINTVLAHDNTTSCLCLSGNTVYSGSWDGRLKAWDLNKLLDSSVPSSVVMCGAGIKAMVCCNDRVFLGLTSKNIVTYIAK